MFGYHLDNEIWNHSWSQITDESKPNRKDIVSVSPSTREKSSNRSICPVLVVFTAYVDDFGDHGHPHKIGGIFGPGFGHD